MTIRDLFILLTGSRPSLKCLWLPVLAIAAGRSLVLGQTESNVPPEVSISWPSRGDLFRAGTWIKIEARAADPDGSVAQVQFLADTNVIGLVTNPPFSTVWVVDTKYPGQDFATWCLRAVATDNRGAVTESTPVTILYYTGAPTRPVVRIDSPPPGAVLAAPATFVFRAELLASVGDAGPVEFLVGSNSVGVVDGQADFTASLPPYSVTVTNLPAGNYALSTRYLGGNGAFCLCGSQSIRVTALGLQFPRLTADARFQFDVVTSFPGKETVIEISGNLVDWLPISTNVPSNDSFTFIDSSPPTNSSRFYRAIVPQKQHAARSDGHPSPAPPQPSAHPAT